MTAQKGNSYKKLFFEIRRVKMLCPNGLIWEVHLTDKRIFWPSGLVISIKFIIP